MTLSLVRSKRLNGKKGANEHAPQDVVALDEPLTPCPRCGHLLGHHGSQDCEHTPGYADPYADPSY